ncbi:MAG: nickel-dependent hydrogenase large subunit [Planctomycetes bacterium]|nr:nickel-dependent hydrogenase large subunit [Planctomycetota bacterium]
MSTTDVIEVPILTRVEGEGGVTIRVRQNTIENVQLRIYEPPRLFEALLCGRALEDTPDITARICGICPVAYQMSSVHALEAALGIQTTPQIRRLRRLLYCGEWIESHALHIHLLHAPDFFGAASGIELAQRFPQEITRGLQLKKHGNRLLEALGGRAIHPINVAVGGFYRLPRREELAGLIPDFEWGLEAAIAATRWVASFPFPELTQPYEFVSLSHPDEYPFNEGEIVSSQGLRVPVTEFDRHFVEVHVAHSTALQAVRHEQRTPYFVGPLARINLNRGQLSQTVQRLADEVGMESECRNPFRSIIARALELVQVYEEALDILRGYHPSGPSRMPYQPAAGQACAATEAPRGLLFHDYQIDDAGKIRQARIIPPTSQNQRQIEGDLTTYLSRNLQAKASREELASDCERLVRTYDPCISCSTHFLRVRWEEIP